MRKKLLAAVLAATAALCGAFGLSACDNGNDDKQPSNEWGSEYSVQSAYAVAQNLGYTGTLEEFIATISGKDGEDGKDGVGIDNAYIDEEGCLILVLTNSKTINCGKISTSNVEKQDFQYVTIKENNQVTGYSIIGINTGTVVDSDLIIPSSYQGKPVKEIATGAFKDNIHFTSVTIPDSITTIGRSAFSGCSSLAEIRYTGNISDWCGISGLYSLTSNGTEDRKLFIGGAEIKGNLVIPNGVTSIGDGAFCGCSSLTGLTIPRSLTEIGSSAFSDCSSLANVAIPNSVTKIGTFAFGNCTSFTNVTIPDSVTEIGSSAFSGCTALESATIPATAISEIYKTNLKTVVITKGESIGDYAFYGCASLESITMPNSITQIGKYAFSGCKSLTSVTIPGRVTSIGNYAFEECFSLTSVQIDNGATQIGSHMFQDCHSLESITIPNSVTTIGEYAFWSCYSLTKILIPNSVTYISGSAFSSCYSLTVYCEAAKQSDKWNEYWNNSYCPVVWDCKNNEVADDGCIYCISDGLRYSLKDGEATVVKQSRALSGAVIIPEAVTYKGTTYSIAKIAYSAFMYAHVESVTIPNGMTKIDESAFSGCSTLTSVIIPDSVTVIGYRAFDNCSNLISITYKGTKKQWNELEKDYYWNYRTDEYIVHCTDGDIAKS